MCGICGIFGEKSVEEAEAIVRKMMVAMYHRGPDDEGLIVDLPTAFGMRRLSIIDISGGHQPMFNEDGSIVVVFNGEICNFQELRQTLEAKGHIFRTRSDTEVIVHAYEEWGEDFVKRLRGMFAIAIWDRRKGKGDEGKLLLVRDPLGIKPLYYYCGDDFFLFASEVRALLASGLVPRQLNIAGLWTYLCFGSVQEPFTMIDGVFALSPGTALLVQRRTNTLWMEQRCYFRLDSLDSPIPQFSDLRRVGELLTETVHQWLISDVPLGIFLSGGIDSAAVLALARKALSKEASLRTFTIAFREESFNEAPLARRTAERFGAEHTEVLVTPEEVLSRLPEAIAAMDQPTMDGINTYFVSDAAKRAGLTVALSGLGGDELFAGYSTFRTVPRLRRWLQVFAQLPSPMRKYIGGMISLLPIAPDAKSKLQALMAGETYLSKPHIQNLGSQIGNLVCLSYLFARALFSPRSVADLLASVVDAVDLRLWWEWVEEVWQEAQGYELLGVVSVLELRHYLLNTLLRDTDFMSMAHSLEVRPPLLDTSIVAAILPLPDRIKNDGTTPKALLVQAVGDLPDEVVHRRKTTFTFPWELWLRTKLRSEVENTLHNSDVLCNILNRSAVLQIWDNFLRGRTNWSRPWALYVLMKWIERLELTAFR